MIKKAIAIIAAAMFVAASLGCIVAFASDYGCAGWAYCKCPLKDAAAETDRELQISYEPCSECAAWNCTCVVNGCAECVGTK